MDVVSCLPGALAGGSLIFLKPCHQPLSSTPVNIDRGYIENGGDPFSLQRILGHTKEKTTLEYVNMARTNVKSQHSKYSPGERLG